MRSLMWTSLAVALLLAAGSASWANDVVRLGGPSAQTAIDGGTDTELVRGGHGGHYGGGHYGGRGYYGGGYYGRGYYGGGYYGGYYGRGYYGYYRPYYYGYGYYPYYPSFYSGYYGYNSPYCYSSPYATYYSPYYAVSNTGPAISTQAPLYAQNSPPRSSELLPAPRASNPGVVYTSGSSSSELLPAPVSNDKRTFPYDGGPRSTVPLPGDAPAPMKDPRGNIPLEGKVASLPKETTGGVASMVTPEIQRLTYVSYTNSSAQPHPAPARIAYPAYGEQVIPPAPRKTINR